MGGSPACLDLGVDRASNLVTREKLRRALVVVGIGVPTVCFFLSLGVLRLEDIGDVVEHEATALGVRENSAVTTHRLGDQEALDRRRPDHARGMELDEFHVDQRATDDHRHRVAVTGVLPRVRGDLERLADTAGGNHNSGSVDGHECARWAPVGQHAGGATIVTLAVHEDLGDRALGEHADAGFVVAELLLVLLLKLDDLLLEGADHLQAGAVADMGEARVLMATEVALADLAVGGAVEESAVGLELPDALGRFLGVQLCHAVLVQELAAAHGVAEVDAPAVVLVDVRHGSSDATLGHDGVRLAEE